MIAIMAKNQEENTNHYPYRFEGTKGEVNTPCLLVTALPRRRGSKKEKRSPEKGSLKKIGLEQEETRLLGGSRTFRAYLTAGGGQGRPSISKERKVYRGIRKKMCRRTRGE